MLFVSMKIVIGLKWLIVKEKRMNEKNYIKEEDVIGKEIIAKQLQAVIDEIPLYETNIEKTKEQLKNFTKQFELDKQIYAMMLKEFTRVPENCTWRFEQNDAYIELQKKKQEFRVREDIYKGDSKVLALNLQLANFEKELDDIYVQKEKLEKDLSLEGD